MFPQNSRAGFNQKVLGQRCKEAISSWTKILLHLSFHMGITGVMAYGLKINTADRT